MYFLLLSTSITSNLVAPQKCIIEAFHDRFLITFFIFSHLKQSKTIRCEFFDCLSKIYKNKLPSIPTNIVLDSSYAGIVRGWEL